MSPTEEENPDESETLGTIAPIIPEKPSVTTEAVSYTHLDVYKRQDLPELKKGDEFYIEVNGKTLAYQVDQIKTVEPTDTKDCLLYTSMLEKQQHQGFLMYILMCVGMFRKKSRHWIWS